MAKLCAEEEGMRLCTLGHSFVALIVVAVLCGCGSQTILSPLGLASLAIAPAPMTIGVGDSTNLVLTGTYSNGDTSQLNRAASWSATSNVATVQTSGEVKCQSVGTTTVVATVAKLSASATVICLQSSANSTGTPSSSSTGGSTSSPQSGSASSSSNGSTSSSLSGSDMNSSGGPNSPSQSDSNSASNNGSTSSAPEGSSSPPGSGSSAAGSSSAISVSAPGSRIPVGYALTAAATLASSTGSTDITGDAQWSVYPAEFASVDAGKITCLQAGPVVVEATYSNTTGVDNLLCAPTSFYSPTRFIDQSEEFVGPFSSWANLRTIYGAKGDGFTDDTQAIQNALDQLPSTHVLYIPAGTYRITQTLTIKNQQSFAIIGADPRTTSIVWGGAPGGTMFDIDGSTVFRITRLTFDGSDSAAVAEYLSDNTNGNYTTKVELSDEHLKNVDYGIYLNPGAEVAIERVFFDHNHIDGMLLTSFNDINIFVNDSLFSYCGTGVSNYPGAGGFYVSNSFFDHSAKADMQIANTGSFSARHDTSVDSGGSFFAAQTIGANNAEITLQDNTVIDPAGVAVSLGDTGPLMLIDNVFRTKNINVPVVSGFDNSTITPAVAMSFGNVYTSGQPLSQFWGTSSSYDDATVDPDSIPTPSIPDNVYVPINHNRSVFEVTGNDDVAIQAAINAAAASGTVKPIVHLPINHYVLNRTITFPLGSDIQMVGDEVNGTQLYRNFSPSSGPLLSVPSMSASISNLTLNAMNDWGSGDGLLIQLPDQPGSRIVGNQLLLQGGNGTSVLSDGIEHAVINLSSLYTEGTLAGIAVSGGPFRSNGEATLGRVDYLSGSIQSQGQGVSLSVTQHGRLLVQDNWHDGGATGPYNFQLTDSGTLTEQEGGVYAGPTPFVMNNFSGDVALLGLQFGGGFNISATSNKANVLIMGMAEEGSPLIEPQGSNLVTVTNLFNGAYYYQYGGYKQTTSSSVDLLWLRHMLGQVRSETAVPLAGTSSPITHLNRVQILNVGDALHFVPGSPLPGHYLTVRNASGLLANGGSCMYTTSTSEDDPTTHWVFAWGGEGDFMLVPADQQQGNGAASAIQDSDGNWVVAVDPITPDYQQHWNVQLGADGLFRLVNRGTGLSLATGSTTNPCATIANQSKGSSTEWTVVAH